MRRRCSSAAVTLAATALATGERLQLPRDAMTWGAIAYLAIAGSVVTFLGYFSLLKTWSVTSLSFISVFTPAIALALGFVFLDEQPTLLDGGWCRTDPLWRPAGARETSAAHPLKPAPASLQRYEGPLWALRIRGRAT